MQVKRLKEIAKISLGYSFRGSIQEEKDGNMFVIQAKNVKDNFYIQNTDKLVKIKHPIYEDRLVKQNDIILSSRGYFNASVSKTSENMIASSSVYIIRSLNPNIILPEYLALYLNSKKGQFLLKRNQTGSMVKVILKTDLEGIDIIIPDIEKQKILIQSFNVLRDIEKLLSTKKELLEQNFNGLFTKITHQN